MGKTSVKTVLLTKKKSRKEGGKGSKKYGRNLAKCALYKKEGKREKNKARKQRKHQHRIEKKLLKLQKRKLK